MYVAVLLLLEFLASRDARAAERAGHEPREGEFLWFVAHRITQHFLLHLVEEFFRDNRRMLADVPLTAAFRIFEGAVVEVSSAG